MTARTSEQSVDANDLVLKSYIGHKDFFVLRQAQETPPGLGNGLDWRALVQLRPPNSGKQRGKHFILFYFFHSKFLYFFENFLFLFISSYLFSFCFLTIFGFFWIKKRDFFGIFKNFLDTF